MNLLPPHPAMIEHGHPLQDRRARRWTREEIARGMRSGKSGLACRMMLSDLLADNPHRAELIAVYDAAYNAALYGEASE